MNQTEIFEQTSISTSVFDDIKQFAKDVYKTNADKYADRNQEDRNAIINQNISGKIGEWIVYDTLQPYFPDMLEPDMKVYEVKKKDWGPDLTAAGLDFIVKSQDDNSRRSYPVSWTFNFSDKEGGGGRDKEVFDNPQPTSLCVFVSVNVKYSAGSIRAIVPVPILHQFDLFRDPEKEDLAGIKKTIHLFDLRQHNFSQRVPKILLKKVTSPDKIDLGI